MHHMFRSAVPVVSACLLLASCSKVNSSQIDFQMGDKILVGPLTYTLVEATWKGQLGEGYKSRSPEQRFLLLTIAVTNSGGKEVSIPLLQLEGPNGQTFTEVANGDGVDQWFGLLRSINPAQTQQGRILFDVPLTSYRL